MSERCRAGVYGHVLLDGIGSVNMLPKDRKALDRAGCQVAVCRPVEPGARPDVKGLRGGSSAFPPSARGPWQRFRELLSLPVKKEL